MADTPAAAAAATPAPAAAPAVAATAPTASPVATPSAAAPAAQNAGPTTPAAEPAAAAAASSTAQPPTAPKPEVIRSLLGDDAPAEGAEPAKPAEPAAPVEGEPVYDIKLPDGVEVDAAQMDAAKAIFGKAKVSPEAAQELATFHASQLVALKTQMENNQIDAWNTFVRGEQQKVMADPVIGGTKFPESKARIESGLKTFFGITPTTPANAPERAAHAEFMGVLKYTAAGSTLPMLRFLDKVAGPRSEGRPAPVGGPSAPRKSMAEIMYPSKQAAE